MSVEPIRWQAATLHLLDQRLLPHQVEYVPCESVFQVVGAIRDMLVRGAPAIGVTAAFGVVLSIRDAGDVSTAMQLLRASAPLLKGARPTAVNLAWAVDRMMDLAERSAPGVKDVAELSELLETEARRIFDEDVEANRRIGRHGAELLGASSTILTHCNAGALATAGYGTALGVVRAAAESGKRIAVFADETRPYLQGARLTAWELQQDGIDVTLITDSMAGHFFQKGTFDAVIVGADRIAMNGDTANKIGTYMVAVLARTHDVPFYVAAPLSTIDPKCASGSEIPIEERNREEVGEAHGRDVDGKIHTVRTAPPGTEMRHPAFDVTPASYITAIITERGVARAPFETTLRRMLEER